MRATNAGDMHRASFLTRNIMLVHRLLNKPRSTFLLSAFLGSAMLLAGSLSCGPPAGGGKQGSSESQSDNVPELTDEVIRERIHETWVREVPSENVNSAPISWGFSRDEP